MDISLDQDGHFRALLRGVGFPRFGSRRLRSLALFQQLPRSCGHARPAVVLHPRRAGSADAPRPLLAAGQSSTSCRSITRPCYDSVSVDLGGRRRGSLSATSATGRQSLHPAYQGRWCTWLISAIRTAWHKYIKPVTCHHKAASRP